MAHPPRISHRTWTLPDLLAEHRAGRLLLPVMQREWSWSESQEDAFARSLVRGIPLGTIVLAQRDRRGEMFPTWPPPWCYRFPLVPFGTPPPDGGEFIVLDGRHRIEALLRLRNSITPINSGLGLGGEEWIHFPAPQVCDVARAMYAPAKADCWPRTQYMLRTGLSPVDMLGSSGDTRGRIGSKEKKDEADRLHVLLDHHHLRAPMVHVVIIEDATMADWVETIRAYSRAGAPWTDAQLAELEQAAETFAPPAT